MAPKWPELDQNLKLFSAPPPPDSAPRPPAVLDVHTQGPAYKKWSRAPKFENRHCFLFMVKFVKRLFLTIFIFILLQITLLLKNQSGFRPGDSTTNQLIDLGDEIYQSFDETKSLKVRAIFLDISKAFEKVWHDGLIFKLKHNGVRYIVEITTKLLK